MLVNSGSLKGRECIDLLMEGDVLRDARLDSLLQFSNSSVGNVVAVPTESVTRPCYNRASTVNKCVINLLKLAFQTFRLLIVNAESINRTQDDDAVKKA